MEYTLDSLGFVDTNKLPKPEEMSIEELKFCLDHWPPEMKNGRGLYSDRGRWRYNKAFNEYYEKKWSEDV